LSTKGETFLLPLPGTTSSRCLQPLTLIPPNLTSEPAEDGTTCHPWSQGLFLLPNTVLTKTFHLPTTDITTSRRSSTRVVSCLRPRGSEAHSIIIRGRWEMRQGWLTTTSLDRTVKETNTKTHIQTDKQTNFVINFSSECAIFKNTFSTVFVRNFELSVYQR
jgi:hypothetical protein